MFVDRICLGVTVALFVASPASSDEPPPGLDANIKELISTALEISDEIQDMVWPGWSDIPPELLLITEKTEFLVSDLPRDGQGFRASEATVSGHPVRYRDRVFQTNFLATFPPFGPPATIIVGTPENTDLTEIGWIATVGHEHFHQYQFAQPGYSEGTDALDLANGDETGMWMLNYPFPYDDEAVVVAFHKMALALRVAYGKKDDGDLEKALKDYLASKATFRAILEPADYRYFSLQLWQEGVARYVQYMFARAAATAQTNHSYSSSEFKKDATDLLNKSLGKLEQPDLIKANLRVAFYPFGMIEALLLDRARPGWKALYFEEMFSTDSYFDGE